MYYHAQELKYATYGKIYPAPIEIVDDVWIKAYQWLGKYCGYCPQVWLSRSKSSITGYKNQHKRKKSKFFGARKNFEPNVMFAFDIIKGFPVDYELWCFCLNALINCKNPVKDGDDAIKKSFDSWAKDVASDPEMFGEISELPFDDELAQWIRSKNFNDFLNNYLFVEKDQVVVPSLNLKSAKQVFCRNEKQVKSLRRMGFIKDRIKIVKPKLWI